ncbi:MAG: hypothetical protein RLZZ111_309 [Planctomycetota bacterium]|jgi:hypothetical protein
MSPAADRLLAEIHDLTTRLLDGTAASADRERLERLVAESPEARRLYVAYMQDTAVLRWQHHASSSELLHDLSAVITPPGAASRPSRSTWRWAMAGLSAVSAAMIVATTLLVQQGSVPPADPAAQAPADATAAQPAAAPPAAPGSAAVPARYGVATLMRTADVVWGDDDDRAELMRLAAGEVLRFDSGEVEVVFDAGVEVRVRGPAEFEVRAADYAVARLGAISARVGKNGRGFTIETPTARVIDLGTEFGIDVAPCGATEVAVFKGLVDLSVGSDATAVGAPRRLRQGEALRVAADGSLRRVVAIPSDRYPSVVRPVTVDPGPAVIGSVDDDNGDAESQKFYRIVRGGLREDAQAFVDRNHQWNGATAAGIPAFLRGIDYIMPYNDDKFADSLHVSVELKRPATLYVLYSDSLPVPDWLRRDFVDTGHDIGLDEAKNRFLPSRRTDVGPGASVDTIFSVWARAVPVPTTMTLGAVEMPVGREGYNMYGIAAGPLVELPGADHDAARD